jgi:hypothetical protein
MGKKYEKVESFKYLETIIRPAVTYGAETWTVTNRTEKMLMT